MFEVIVTGASIVLDDTEDGSPYVTTQVHRFEFDTFEDMQNAISGMATAHGCLNAERMSAADNRAD